MKLPRARRAAVLVGIVAVLAGAAWSLDVRLGRVDGPLELDAPLPDLALATLDGEPLSLGSLRGRPLVVNFWASWCPPCRDEFPLLAAARDRGAPDRLEVLGIIRADGLDHARAFVAEARAAWPMAQDPGAVAWDSFGATGLPTSFFVSRDGRIRSVVRGPLTASTLTEHLERIDAAAPGVAAPDAGGDNVSLTGG